MPEVNLQLLPETRKKIEVHARGENTYLVASVVLLIIVVGIYAAAYFYRTSIVNSIQSVDNDLNTLEQQRDKITEDTLLTLHKKLKVAEPLLSAHLFWSDGFARIEKLIQPQVQFKTMGAQFSDRKISVKADAASYTVVARQIAAFLSDPVFSKLVINRVSALPTGKVEFTLEMQFDPSKVLIRQK